MGTATCALTRLHLKHQAVTVVNVAPPPPPSNDPTSVSARRSDSPSRRLDDHGPAAAATSTATGRRPRDGNDADADAQPPVVSTERPRLRRQANAFVLTARAPLRKGSEAFLRRKEVERRASSALGFVEESNPHDAFLSIGSRSTSLHPRRGSSLRRTRASGGLRGCARSAWTRVCSES